MARPVPVRHGGRSENTRQKGNPKVDMHLVFYLVRLAFYICVRVRWHDFRRVLVNGGRVSKGIP